MSAPQKFKIELPEAFPHLAKAPITEAVIAVTARATAPWDELKITDALRSRLPEYPEIDKRHSIELREEFSVAEGNSRRSIKNLGISAFRVRNKNLPHVVLFSRDEFLCSRLEPYDTWEQFVAEALRVWVVHQEIAIPVEATKLGLRFINRISLPKDPVNLSEYFVHAPRQPNGMEVPLGLFIHNEVFSVPDHDYIIIINRAVQPDDKRQDSAALILDIDIQTRTPFEPTIDNLTKRLNEMRWLKNRTFFGSITKEFQEKLI